MRHQQERNQRGYGRADRQPQLVKSWSFIICIRCVSYFNHNVFNRLFCFRALTEAKSFSRSRLPRTEAPDEPSLQTNQIRICVGWRDLDGIGSKEIREVPVEWVFSPIGFRLAARNNPARHASNLHETEKCVSQADTHHVVADTFVGERNCYQSSKLP